MRTWKLILLTGLLAACSGHTVYRLEVDLLSFLPEDQRSGSLTLQAGSAETVLPGNEGQPVGLPGSEALVDAWMQVALDLTNQTDADLSGALEVRVGPENDTNLFDGSGDVLWGSASVSIPQGGNGSLSLDFTLDPNANPSVYNLVRSGRFRVAAKVSLSAGAGDVDYTWKQADLNLRLKPFNLIPNP
ncbi:hypothetical protein [Thermus filiformis]|uniref:Lipoprotein n=1 Tax=Thermus filiformis TaxID=276 RepID=A0A0A2WPF9_THEFI|nr:hypothetical protein [Thermus filiformis]KGQ22071.1 hypothetical protein THFILI_07820 [Thermus filiformis]